MRPKTEKENCPPPNPLIPNHLIIEGDNLVSLSALAYTHAGKIDVIYIDPPYNTGNKDFVYNDSFVDKEDAYRHSKWLSFMERRLRIAKKLLSDRGVIFISIDDNEAAALKMLCDSSDFFGASNFAGQLVWFKKRKGSFLSNKVVSMTEYVLVYSKNPEIKLFGGKPSNKESQPIIKRTNAKKILRFEAFTIKTKLQDGCYPKGIYGEGTSASELLEDVYVKDGLISSALKISAPFTWSQEFLNEEISKGTEIIVNTKNFQIRAIRHNNDSIKAMPSFIDGREEKATNEDAYELLKEIFATDRPFQYSKPVNLVKKLVLANSYFDKNSTILDFFAGSGTTLHAVMQLNAEDGGHRQCILCTNNENGICENVTYERNKRVIQGYTKPNGEKVEGLHDNSLRYYRTEFISRNRTPRNMQRLVELSTDMLCIKEDLYAEQTEFGGMRIVPRVFRYFAEGERKMLIIYREEYIEDIVRLIAKVETTAPIRVYVFSPCEDPASELFEPVAEKVEPVALPAAIYNTYKRILPKRRDRRVDTGADAEGGTYTETDNELGGLFETQDEA